MRTELRKAEDKTRKKIEQEGEQKSTRGKEKVIKNRRPQETMPGHSQRLKRGDENELGRKLRLENVVATKQLRMAVETKEEQDRRTMQLSNGSGWSWRWTKKEKQDWRRWYLPHSSGWPWRQRRKEEQKKRNRLDLDLILI